MRYTIDQRDKKSAAKICEEVLELLLHGNLMEEIDGNLPARRGRRVREFQWKPWASIISQPTSEAFRRRLGLGEEDFQSFA